MENSVKADYIDFFLASKEEAAKQIERAEYFSKIIREYLIKKNVLESEPQ